MPAPSAPAQSSSATLLGAPGPGWPVTTASAWSAPPAASSLRSGHAGQTRFPSAPNPPGVLTDSTGAAGVITPLKQRKLFD